MCGIAGFLLSRTAGWSVDAMTSALRHRGPDGAGVWTGQHGRVAFGQTRLAIIDLDGGRQPMTSWDEKYVIVLNGEIYNYKDLQLELRSLGHKFNTSSDTEVVIECCRRWGSDAFKRLHGMFAFALFDTSTGEVILARDRVGIKPLYYYDGEEGLAFASEMKAILGLPGVPRRVDVEALADFFEFGYPVLPKTLFRDIKEFPPGCFLRLQGEHRQWGRYWRWQRRSTAERVTSIEDALGLAEDALKQSIREHLVADVPIGAQLSGGIDSSLIAAIVTKELGRNISTYTVKFSEQAFDESDVARETAQMLGTDHHELHLERGGLDVVGRVLDQFDQPFADSSAIPNWLLAAEIRKSRKVVLAGDGGDETFGGYPRFAHADFARRIGPMIRPIGSVLEPILQHVPIGADLKRAARRMLRASVRPDVGRLRALSCYVWPEDLSKVISPDLASVLHADRSPYPEHDYFEDPGGEEFVDYTMNYALPGDYLRKVDVTSSAHGLEVRVPFLGIQVLDLSTRLDRDIKYNLKVNKILLRRLAKKYLPETVTSRPKSGFGIPLDKWISSADRTAIADQLMSTTSSLQGIVTQSYRDEILSAFSSGEWDRSRHSRFMIFQKSYQLWALERWMDRWKPAIAHS